MSKTLCIHPEDKSTVMLKVIYEDKDWDVITDCNISRKELIEQIESHDRIIMMGHGTPRGLLNPKRWSYLIDKELVPYLKKKDTISIWCNSDKFFKDNDFHDGNLHTGNIPSEVWEETAAIGYAPLDKDEIFDNMIKFSEAIRDNIDIYKGEELVKHICEYYNDTDPISEYNRNNLIVL